MRVIDCRKLYCAFLALVFQSAALGNEAVIRGVDGLSVAQKQERSMEGWKSSIGEMKMTLVSPTGASAQRVVKTKSLEIAGSGDYDLVYFDRPSDIRGTAFLTHNHIGRPDDQWLFLPSLKRVKRINANNRSGPFMGSEFSYEDMTSFEVDEYSYHLNDPVDIGGKQFYVLESYPKDENSGYSKKVSWIEEERLISTRVDFYDRQGVFLKTLTATDFKLYLDRYWRPKNLQMKNHTTGSVTQIEWLSIQLDAGLSSGQFTKRSLKRRW